MFAMDKPKPNTGPSQLKAIVKTLFSNGKPKPNT